MVERTAVEAVFLDHNYCAPIHFPKEISIEPKVISGAMASNGETLSWEEEIGIQFDPPSLQSPQPYSSLSPAHSVDSGFDNEMNMFGDLKWDLDDLEILLSEDAKIPNQTPKILSSMKTPSTSTSSSATALPKRSATLTKQKGKAVEDPMDEIEKNKKNAIAARENRLKKKKYVESIEKENIELKQENEALKAKDRNHSQTVEKLENEVSYLKNVIANQSTLSALVKTLVSTPGITFSSSLVSRESEQKSTPPMDDDSDAVDDDDRPYKTRGRKRTSVTASPSTLTKKAPKEVKGGVCLHLGQDKVSLELCEQCSIKAQGNGHQ